MKRWNPSLNRDQDHDAGDQREEDEGVMDVLEDEDADNVGDDDYNDVVEDEDGAIYADAGNLSSFSITVDVGGRLWGGEVNTGCVTIVDG